MIFSKSPYSMSEFLQKDGFKLERVFCDVYSISSSQLVELAAYVCRADGKLTDLLDINEICFTIDTMQNIEDRLVIHSHSKPYPGNNNIIWENALNIWEKCGKVVNLGDKSFHPKLLLACFKNNDGAWYFRLQTSTGNMTSSKSIDMAVVVEGENNCNNKDCNGKVLYLFYKNVFESLKKEFPNELDGLQKTVFASAAHNVIFGDNLWALITDVDFAYTYPNNNESKDYSIKNKILKESKNVEDIHVYSPFVKFENGTTYIDGLLKNQIHYYTNLTEDICEHWNDIKNNNVKYCTNKNPFFHAKVYVWDLPKENENLAKDNGNKVRVWLGSANASRNGWENNAEFNIGFNLELIKLDADRNYIKKDLWMNKRASNLNPDKQVTFKDAEPQKEDAFSSNDDTYWQHILNKKIHIDAKCKDTDSNKVVLKIRVDALSSNLKNVGKVNLVFYDFGSNEIQNICVDTQSTKCIEKENEIERNKFPFRSSMLVLASIEYSGKLKCMKFFVDINCGNVQIEPENRQPEAMVQLMKPIKAIQAIPRCAEKDFINIKDNIYERLSAYLCSYNSSSEERYNTILKRIEKIEEMVDKGKLYYISEKESSKLAAIKNICKGGIPIGIDSVSNCDC